MKDTLSRVVEYVVQNYSSQLADLREEITLLNRCLELYTQAKYEQCVIQLSRGLRIKKYTDTPLDPLLRILLGRSAIQADIAKVNRPSLRSLIVEERFVAFVQANTQLIEMSQGLLSQPENKQTEQQELDYYVLRQFCLYHILVVGSEQGREVSPWETEWLESDFQCFNDYSSVSALILFLCPPQILWDRYTINSVVYQRDSRTGQILALRKENELEDQLYPIEYPFL